MQFVLQTEGNTQTLRRTFTLSASARVHEVEKPLKTAETQLAFTRLFSGRVAGCQWPQLQTTVLWLLPKQAQLTPKDEEPRTPAYARGAGKRLQCVCRFHIVLI